MRSLPLILLSCFFAIAHGRTFYLPFNSGFYNNTEYGSIFGGVIFGPGSIALQGKPKDVPNYGYINPTSSSITIDVPSGFWALNFSFGSDGVEAIVSAYSKRNLQGFIGSWTLAAGDGQTATVYQLPFAGVAYSLSINSTSPQKTRFDNFIFEVNDPVLVRSKVITFEDFSGGRVEIANYYKNSLGISFSSPGFIYGYEQDSFFQAPSKPSYVAAFRNGVMNFTKPIVSFSTYYSASSPITFNCWSELNGGGTLLGTIVSGTTRSTYYFSSLNLTCSSEALSVTTSLSTTVELDNIRFDSMVPASGYVMTFEELGNPYGLEVTDLYRSRGILFSSGLKAYASDYEQPSYPVVVQPPIYLVMNSSDSFFTFSGSYASNGGSGTLNCYSDANGQGSLLESISIGSTGSLSTWSSFRLDCGKSAKSVVMQFQNFFYLDSLMLHYLLPEAPTTAPTTAVPTTLPPTTIAPTTFAPTTVEPTTSVPDPFVVVMTFDEIINGTEVGQLYNSSSRFGITFGSGFLAYNNTGLPGNQPSLPNYAWNTNYYALLTTNSMFTSFTTYYSGIENHNVVFTCHSTLDGSEQPLGTTTSYPTGSYDYYTTSTVNCVNGRGRSILMTFAIPESIRFDNIRIEFTRPTTTVVPTTFALEYIPYPYGLRSFTINFDEYNKPVADDVGSKYSSQGLQFTSFVAAYSSNVQPPSPSNWAQLQNYKASFTSQQGFVAVSGYLYASTPYTFTCYSASGDSIGTSYYYGSPELGSWQPFNLTCEQQVGHKVVINVGDLNAGAIDSLRVDFLAPYTGPPINTTIAPTTTGIPTTTVTPTTTLMPTTSAPVPQAPTTTAASTTETLTTSNPTSTSSLSTTPSTTQSPTSSTSKPTEVPNLSTALPTSSTTKVPTSSSTTNTPTSAHETTRPSTSSSSTTRTTFSSSIKSTTAPTSEELTSSPETSEEPRFTSTAADSNTTRGTLTVEGHIDDNQAQLGLEETEKLLLGNDFNNETRRFVFDSVEYSTKKRAESSQVNFHINEDGESSVTSVDLIQSLQDVVHNHPEKLESTGFENPQLEIKTVNYAVDAPNSSVTKNVVVSSANLALFTSTFISLAFLLLL